MYPAWSDLSGKIKKEIFQTRLSMHKKTGNHPIGGFLFHWIHKIVRAIPADVCHDYFLK